MKISPQITQINTDYKKYEKISVISVICGPLFFHTSPGVAAVSIDIIRHFLYYILMKKRGYVKNKIVITVIFVLIAICAFTREITQKDLQDKGVLLQSIGDEELLCVINTGNENGAYWFILKDMGRGRELGSNLSCLYQVDHILPSPDNRYLAVLSVGEGHPMVEVIDLEKLRLHSKYAVLQTIDPYPGIVSIDRWDGAHLIVNSNAPLTQRKEDGRVDPDPMLPKDEAFSLDVATGEIKSTTPDKEK